MKFLFEYWKTFHLCASLTREILFNMRKKNFYLQAAMLYSIIININTNEKPNYFSFATKGGIYYVTILTGYFYV